MADYDHEISTDITVRWKAIVGAIKAKLVAAVLYGTSSTTGDTAVKVDGDGHLQVDGLSSALPSGAATAARQDTGNTSVASVDTKLGEVQASPTANTLLARLKAIADALAGALTATVTQGAAGAAAWPTSDAGPNWTSTRQLTTSADMTGAADLTAAPTAGQKIVIDDVIFSSDAAMYMSFLEETSGTELFRIYVAAGGTAQVTTRGKMKLPVADKKLRGDASLAGNVAVTVLYHSEA